MRQRAAGHHMLFFLRIDVMVFACGWGTVPLAAGGIVCWRAGDTRRKSRVKIEGSYTFNAPREKVWEVLLDPKVMAQCIPGCEGLNQIGPDQYEATMKVGIAAVKGSYKGKVTIKDKQPPSHYVLSGEGAGGPGFMQGDVAIDLKENNGQTVLTYSTDAKVGGLIASIGQRMLGGVAKMMVDQFFKKIESFI